MNGKSIVMMVLFLGHVITAMESVEGDNTKKLQDCLNKKGIYNNEQEIKKFCIKALSFDKKGNYLALGLSQWNNDKYSGPNRGRVLVWDILSQKCIFERDYESGDLDRVGLDEKAERISISTFDEFDMFKVPSSSAATVKIPWCPHSKCVGRGSVTQLGFNEERVVFVRPTLEYSHGNYFHYTSIETMSYDTQREKKDISGDINNHAVCMSKNARCLVINNKTYSQGTSVLEFFNIGQMSSMQKINTLEVGRITSTWLDEVGKRLLVRSEDGSYGVCDIKEGVFGNFTSISSGNSPFPIHEQYVSMSGNGNIIAIRDYGYCHIYDIEKLDAIEKEWIIIDHVTSIELNYEGDLLVIGAQDKIYIFRKKEGKWYQS